MRFGNDDCQRRTNLTLAEYPAFAALGLSGADLLELATQGFVSAEQRDARTYHKLRFRRAGQQVVRYIGDADRAREVERDLAALQHATQTMRRLREVTQLARRELRDAKRVLAPLLTENGFAFHGFAIRRPRRQNSNVKQ
jgi:hypothetical protein